MSMRRTVYLNDVAVGEIECTGTVEGNFRVAHRLLRKLGLKSTASVVDACYESAWQFATTAFDIFSKHEPKDPSLHEQSLPFAVNAAFSIELFLKTLHLIDGAEKRGHKLLGLYNSLPQTRRDAIVVGAREAAPYYHQVVDDESAVRRYVSSLNSTFEDWRYVHELPENQGSGAISTGGTMVVVNGCDLACRMAGAKHPAHFRTHVGDYVRPLVNQVVRELIVPKRDAEIELPPTHTLGRMFPLK